MPEWVCECGWFGDYLKVIRRFCGQYEAVCPTCRESAWLHRGWGKPTRTEATSEDLVNA